MSEVRPLFRLCPTLPNSTVLTLGRCLALPKDLDSTGEPRFREHTELLKETHTHDPTILWDAFGIVSNVIVRCIYPSRRF